MGPDFGERQYEYAVNFEITTVLSGLLVGGMPMIPTTREEATKGYDAVFTLGTGYLYHLQYKVPSFASKSTPRNAARWAHHAGPYYVLSLLPASDGLCRQHLKLEELRSHEPAVYYCAPAFHLESDFWARASASSVFDGSALIDIADVPLPSPAAPHSITYDIAGSIKVWSDEGPESRWVWTPAARRQHPTRDLSPAAFRRLVLNLVDALASEESVPPRVRRADETSGLRTSIVDMRAPRTLRGDVRQPPQWRSRQEAEAAFAETTADRDRAEAADLVAALDDIEVLLTAARIAALDFGLTTVAEPDGGDA